jgi:RimJ/RimL family protein N-acetyltransferase
MRWSGSSGIRWSAGSSGADRRPRIASGSVSRRCGGTGSCTASAHGRPVEKDSGRLIGHIGLERLDDWPLDHKVEVGWVLHPYYWGRGLATEGGRASVQFGLEKAGLDRIISTTFPGHLASRRVMEKCGLSYRGTLFWEERGIEVVWYEIGRE